MPSAPIPDLNLVNTGAVIDQPFLFQAKNPSTSKVPSSQTFMTKSTLIPGGTAEGTATYTYGPLFELIGESMVTSGAVKTTQYLYVPPDPTAIIAALEAKMIQQEIECIELETQPGVPADAIAAARQRLATTEKKLAAAKEQGSAAPPRLTALKWTEQGDGDLVINGETYFEYEGPDIVRSTSTITTMEVPPRVDQLDAEYRYNDLGQLSEIESADSVVYCEYDEFGRLFVKRGGFVSPAGDFLADHRTVFAYTPPVGDPNQIPPPNALLSSVNDSITGSSPAFDANPEPMKQVPEASALEAAAAPLGGGPEQAAGDGKESPAGWLTKLLGKSPTDALATPSDDAAKASALKDSAAGAPPPPLDLTTLEGDFDTTRVQSMYVYP